LSSNCIRQFEEFHQCRKRYQEEWRVKEQSGEIDEKTVENDFQERQACRFVLGYHNCSNHFNEECFADNELQMMRDNEMAVMMGMLTPRRLPKWDSEKCPPTRDYLYRLKNGYAGFSEECNQAVKELRSCKERAGQKFSEDMEKHYNDEDEALLKKTTCEYQTALMFTCPSRAPTTCFSPELLKKMNFWVFIKEADVPIFLRGGESCSVDKKVLESWSEAKRIHTDAIQVYTTDKVVIDKASEYLGMVSASKTKTIGKSDIGQLLKIQETTKDELLFELKEKAFDKNATAIAGLKIEIYSVFEGMLNMVLYGTLVSF